MTKRSRDPAKPPRKGPLCTKCRKRPTRPRTDLPRVVQVGGPAVARQMDAYHHLCARCYRRHRPHDRRTPGSHPR